MKTWVNRKVLDTVKLIGRKWQKLHVCIILREKHSFFSLKLAFAFLPTVCLFSEPNSSIFSIDVAIDSFLLASSVRGASFWLLSFLLLSDGQKLAETSERKVFLSTQEKHFLHNHPLKLISLRLNNHFWTPRMSVHQKTYRQLHWWKPDKPKRPKLHIKFNLSAKQSHFSFFKKRICVSPS